MSRPEVLSPAGEPPPSGSTDKVPLKVKAAYGFGGMNEMFGHWLYPSLAKPVFNMQLGLSPTLLGAVLMTGRLCDGIIDPFFGWLSDNTRSRWGRRRPYILIGSIAAGLTLPCLFLASASWNALAPWPVNRLFWFTLVTVILYALIMGLFSMPYASLGSELTPSYHERTSVMAFKAVMQKIAGVAGGAAWWVACSFRVDPATGKPDVLRGAQFATAIAGLVMIVAGITSFLGVKERYYERARVQGKTHFWSTCGETFGSRPFLVLLAIAVVFAMTTAIANDLGQYAGTYYVFHGDQQAMSQYSFYSSLGKFVLGLGGVFLATWTARRLGKRKAVLIVFVSGILAYGSSWWMYAPGHVWSFLLNTSFTVVASSGLWVLTPSMCVDVIDDGELRSGQRREGAYNSWLSWSVKLGLAFSQLASGLLLDATGFQATLGGQQTPEAIWRLRVWFAALPVVALSVGTALLALYPLSQKRVLALRRALEAKRGQV
jgi:glycoside/pentoside/hexuronide:cation symporter, GPH family